MGDFEDTIGATGKHGNAGTETGNGNNLKDLENVSQSRGHTLTKSLR